ncbi:MAG TPA: hypothetical protein PLQ38_10230 [Methanothrix sp.]|nr:hypothetical protein [Methanothrix sp.]
MVRLMLNCISGSAIQKSTRQVKNSDMSLENGRTFRRPDGGIAHCLRSNAPSSG